MKRRYAITGCGVRSLGFARALENEFGGHAELVALHDTNPLRMKGFSELIPADIPGFTDFDAMVDATRPTHLIIGTPDDLHDVYIGMGFRRGLEIITEKPLTTTAEKARRILALERQHGREVRVAFNYRYNPYVTRVKERISAGDFGRPLSVSMTYHLDKVHGAEYFRRWHAYMARSGGLLVHKATHHFDLVNWLIGDEPLEVAAFGALLHYGRNGAVRGERCATCPHARDGCAYVMTLHKVEADKAIFDKLYWEAEQADGYYRDRCVFREDIDIHDTMNVLVRYRSGAHMSYALTAYGSFAGYRLSITFEKAVVEAAEQHHGVYMHSDARENVIRVHRGFHRQEQTCEEISVPVDRSAHGGGDARMFRHLFETGRPDPLGHAAGSRDGLMSCLIGIAANESIRRGAAVRIDDLLTGAGERA